VASTIKSNLIYETAASAFRELNFFFSKQSNLRSTALFDNCTCCVIKPHLVKEGRVGEVIDAILSEGYEISALQSFFLDRPTSEEFYEVYKVKIFSHFKSDSMMIIINSIFYSGSIT